MTWRATTATLPLGFPEITPAQVKGIEINAYAQQLAQAAIWIGYLQWLNANGFGWSEPVLTALDSIEHKDALLAFHHDGTVTEAEWRKADFIIGNPPFLGAYRLRTELGSDYVEDLFRVYDGRVSQIADLCVYFFEKARTQIEQDKASRAGLLATNSVRGGANRETLKRIKDSGDIYMAWADEPWILDGAAVRISIIGFDDGSADIYVLNGQVVTSINADLTSSIDITSAKRLKENAGIGFKGIDRTGPFDLAAETAMEMLRAVGNPNGRPNSDVVKPWINAKDIMSRSSDTWVVDFGIDFPEEDAALYEAPFEYVREHVKPVREKNNRERYRRLWWLHGEARPGMRRALFGLKRYIVTPHVSKHRVFVWISREVLPSNLLIAFARDDDYFFGVLHSRVHEVWSLRMGTSLEDRPRYTSSTTFETFPLPWSPGQEPVDDPRVNAIGNAAKKLDELRTNWLNPEGASDADLKKRTLTNLYNAKPTWLQNAHAALDRAVWDAYGWPADEIPADVEEDVILSRLLALNQERAA